MQGLFRSPHVQKEIAYCNFSKARRRTIDHAAFNIRRFSQGGTKRTVNGWPYGGSCSTAPNKATKEYINWRVKCCIILTYTNKHAYISIMKRKGSNSHIHIKLTEIVDPAQRSFACLPPKLRLNSHCIGT